jgi:creatinine amidohydrolase
VTVDTLLVNEVAHLGAEQAHDAGVPVLVTPPVWSGFSPHHLAFGGTLSLELETLQHVIHDIVTSVLENGFDAVLLLNGHGGNTSISNSLTLELGTEYPDTELLALTYFELAAEFIDDYRDTDSGGMSHAGEFETSLMMYLRPELVDTDEADGTARTPAYDEAKQDMFEGGPLAIGEPYDRKTTTGAVGDPTAATAEKGELIYEELGNQLQDLLTRIHDQNSE